MGRFHDATLPKMSDDIQRTLGQHGAKLENLEKALERVAANVETLVASENKREGAKKVVYTIATVLGGISGTVAAKFLK
jgi:hypothetical protein